MALAHKKHTMIIEALLQTDDVIYSNSTHF